jgi:hypothetical protein
MSNRFSPDYDLYSGIATLKIDNAQLHDLGEYTAHAENIAGEDHTTCNVFITEVPNVDSTAFVNPDAFKYLEQPTRVKFDKPKEKNQQPTLEIGDIKDIECSEGDTVSFMCKVKGNPQPSVSILLGIHRILFEST